MATHIKKGRKKKEANIQEIRKIRTLRIFSKYILNDSFDLSSEIPLT